MLEQMPQSGNDMLCHRAEILFSMSPVDIFTKFPTKQAPQMSEEERVLSVRREVTRRIKNLGEEGKTREAIEVCERGTCCPLVAHHQTLSECVSRQGHCIPTCLYRPCIVRSVGRNAPVCRLCRITTLSLMWQRATSHVVYK